MPERIAVFEPELEQILLEVASNPDSELLRAPQPGGVTGPLDLEEGVSVRRAGLSITEKYLVREWRVRAAEVLRQAFNQSIDSGEQGWFVIGLDLSNQRVPRPSEKVLRHKVEGLERLGHSRNCGEDLLGALKRVRSGAPIPTSGRRELIQLSHRLRPTDQSRICLAELEANDGRWQRALAMYQSIHERTVSKESRAYVYCNSVRLFAQAGRPDDQLPVVEAALEVAPVWAYANLKSLMVALDFGEEARAHAGLDRLRDLGPSGMEMLKDELLLQNSEPAISSSPSSPKREALARSLAERCYGEVQEGFKRLARIQ